MGLLLEDIAAMRVAGTTINNNNEMVEENVPEAVGVAIDDSSHQIVILDEVDDGVFEKMGL